MSLRAFMKKLQCNALPAERSHQHIAGRHCNDGPLGYTTLDDGAPLDSAKCGCDGGEQKVELTPPAVEDDSLKTEKGDAQPAVAKKTHGVMCKPRGSQPKSTTYPVSACDEAEVEAIHKCIKNNQAGFCEACLPMFQVREWAGAGAGVKVEVCGNGVSSLLYLYFPGRVPNSRYLLTFSVLRCSYLTLPSLPSLSSLSRRSWSSA